MMRMGRTTVTLMAVVAMALGAPSAEAQLPAPPSAGTLVSPEAERLEAEATALVTNQRRFGKAASLLRKAAGLREPGDPLAVLDLIVAGRLAYYDGSRRTAMSDLEDAAETAASYGDIVSAAHAYLDVAFIANELGDGARAHRMADSALRLSHSPLIDLPTRKALRSRVDIENGGV